MHFHLHGLSKRIGILLAGMILSTSGSGLAIGSTDASRVDLPPDASGAEYRAFFESRPQELQHADARLELILKIGARNLEWLKFINAHQGPNQKKVSFTSKETTLGYPMETPNVYNPDLIEKKYQDTIAQLPPVMKSVLVDGAPFTEQPPVEVKEYIHAGWTVDRVYQSAARWTMMQGYLWQLKGVKRKDARGYYFLAKLADRERAFSDWKNLPVDKQKQYKEWLVEMGLNNGQEEATAAGAVESAVNGNAVNELYQKWLTQAQANYTGFFHIPNFGERDDVTWKNNEMHVPFVDPGSTEVYHFLADNIQDEWQWNGWKLLMDFVPEGKARAHVEFEAGTTPHVNGLGGDVITMDANTPMTEYEVQWTIRHEFGHVLGFPDCYIEFYDDSLAAIVNYQLDITNLMCSRKGHLLQTHFDELSRVYSRPHVSRR